MQLSPTLLRHCFFLAGPTASGKSAAAIVLAERLNAEIISLDSMAIYRGMDIGTAKPSQADRERIPHHLIDVADPHEEFSVTEFVRLAAQAAAEICGRGRVPLFVGGTGLYLRSILRGIYEGPEADWEFRRTLEEQARTNGPQWLHDRLAACDPVTAARLHLNDMRRIIRALEVFELTGKPLSEDQQHGPRPDNERPRIVAWIEPPRDWLRERIDRRVDQMMEAGWLEETRWLMQQTPSPSRTACQALGYRELIDCLNGFTTRDAAVEQIKISTRQFAKRQHTWFRNLEECRPMSIAGNETAESIAERILKEAAIDHE
jgi:tRNA dimethylallyltransferase